MFQHLRRVPSKLLVLWLLQIIARGTLYSTLTHRFPHKKYVFFEKNLESSSLSCYECTGLGLEGKAATAEGGPAAAAAAAAAEGRCKKEQGCIYCEKESSSTRGFFLL